MAPQTTSLTTMTDSLVDMVGVSRMDVMINSSWCEPNKKAAGVGELVGHEVVVDVASSGAGLIRKTETTTKARKQHCRTHKSTKQTIDVVAGHDRYEFRECVPMYLNKRKPCTPRKRLKW